MTTQTYGNNTVMSYPPLVVAGYQATGAAPSWQGDALYLMKSGNASVSLLRKYAIDAANPQELGNVSGSVLGISGMNIGSGGGLAVSPDGTHVVLVTSTTNYGQLVSVNSDLTLNTTLGNTSNIGPVNSTDHILLLPVLMGSFHNGSDQLLWAPISSNGEADVAPFGLGANSNVCLGNLTYQFNFNRLLSGRYDGGNTGYIASLPMGSGGSSTNSIAFWKTNGGAPTHFGDLALSAVDASWTAFSRSINGIAFDEADGNLIIQVTEAITNDTVILKISATDAHVIWKLSVPSVNGYQYSFTFSRIRNSRFHVPCVVGGLVVVYHINTSTGTATTESINGISIVGPFYSDDVTNSIIYYGGFTAGRSVPDAQFVGQWMGNMSNHTVSGQFMRYWFATNPTPPAPPVGQKRRLVDMTGPIWL